jgi:anti-sigma B factor antagonist
VQIDSSAEHGSRLECLPGERGRHKSMTSEHPHLTIDVTNTAQTVTILLTGEADLLGAPQIEAAVKDASTLDPKPALIVIDLRNLKFIDSSGLQALLAAHQHCHACGHDLRIIRGPANVERLFELTGMHKALPMVDAGDLDTTAAG